MSQNDEIASSAGQGEPTTDSVYDFLYHDARRIGSFIAQIDPAGHLTSLKQTEAVETGSGMDFSANTSGTIAIARAGAAMQDRSTASERESLERTYDPLWTNALALLDMLDERGMIHDGLRTARIGQIVKVSGSLSVTDLTLWKGLWSLPALKEVLTENAVSSQEGSSGLQNREQRKRSEGSKRNLTPIKSVLEHQMDAGLAIIGMLPHTIQARITLDDRDTVWCSLRDDGLVVSASDLTLKHGVTVAGRWTMVGMLDALPEVNALGVPIDPADANATNVNPIGTSSITELMLTLTPAIRTILGRPAQSYGMTPLVIFRELRG